jgi:hypothetical protein
MEINVTTVQDKKRLIRYSDYYAKMRKSYFIIYAVLTLWIFILDAYLYIKDALTFEMIALSVLAVVLDLILVTAFWIVPRLTIRKSPSHNAVLNYIFREDGADFTAEAAMMKNSGSFKYPAIVKVCYNDPDLYLFISKRQAYVVDTAELSETELYALRGLVTSHLPPRKVKWK